MSPNHDILPYDDLVWVCSNLCDLLEVENDALTRHDAETVRELAENKVALARLYEKSVLPMAETPELVESLEPEQVEELKALGMRLAHLVSTNAIMLRAEMDACERVMDAMVSAAKCHATNTVSYSNRGNFEVLQKGSDRNSLALNKTL